MNTYDTLEKINIFLMGLKRHRKYKLGNKYIGIDIGCEDKNIPEYLGLDGSILIYIMNSKIIPHFLKKKFYNKTCTSQRISMVKFIKTLDNKQVIHHNLSYGIPFENGVIPNIYTAHFLEHLNEKTTKDVLEECFRVLKIGGILRICIPSIEEEIKIIEKAIKEYGNGNSAPIQPYVTSDSLRRNSFAPHRRMYSFSDISAILKKIGYRNIRQVQFRKGKLPLVEEIEWHGGLIVEAKK